MPPLATKPLLRAPLGSLGVDCVPARSNTKAICTDADRCACVGSGGLDQGMAEMCRAPKSGSGASIGHVERVPSRVVPGQGDEGDWLGRASELESATSEGQSATVSSQSATR